MGITSWLWDIQGGATLGVIWAIMALGLYLTYRVLNYADLTVDGSICTGAAVCAMMMTMGAPLPLAMICAFIAGMLAGAITGFFHTFMGIPAILSGILTQLILSLVAVDECTNERVIDCVPRLNEQEKDGKQTRFQHHVHEPEGLNRALQTEA